MREIYRVLDANINRLREGLRVLEEVSRFILNDRDMTARLKNLRHQATAAANSLPEGFMELIGARESTTDVGADSWTAAEMTRSSLTALTTANCKRVQEAARVLEEFGKLCVGDGARTFKEIRFMAYELERELLKNISDGVLNETVSNR
ncbi:MAG: hypothetical protein FWD21_04295 [Peptococcaceae bacterium]|nr:hypothetical protein [Peptococcaceae bacterium]